jgi:hypothetical protein
MLRDLGNMIASQVTIAPQTIGSTGSASVNGVGVDRKGYESAVFVFNNSAVKYITTCPTAITVTCTVQESDDDSTYAAATGYSETHAVTTTYTQTEIEVADLKPLKRYVRGYMAYAEDGGSGDFIVLSATIVLGSPDNYPV